MNFSYKNFKHVLFFAFGFLTIACEKKESAEKLSSNPELYVRGRAVYQTSCTACHHSNPSLAGSIGPEVKGASIELLEARILRGEYPEGYLPKRKTKAMQAMPQLSADIPALHEFLKNK